MEFVWNAGMDTFDSPRATGGLNLGLKKAMGFDLNGVQMWTVIQEPISWSLSVPDSIKATWDASADELVHCTLIITRSFIAWFQL